MKHQQVWLGHAPRESIFHSYVESAFRRTVITVRLKPDTTYNWKAL